MRAELPAGNHRLAGMKALAVAAVLLAIGGCSPAATREPTTTGKPGDSGSIPPVIFGTPRPTEGGAADGLVEDLVTAGASAKVGSNFLAAPLPGEGILVCIGTEPVQIYLLKDHDAALAAASKIDRDDPTKIGTSIVDWAGRPRFWLRDRILVLYLGDNAATDAALRDVLGPPFAESHVAGRPPLPAPDCT